MTSTDPLTYKSNDIFRCVFEWHITLNVLLFLHYKYSIVTFIITLWIR